MLPKGFDLPGFIKRGLEGTITREDIEAVLVPLDPYVCVALMED
jgi:hypothetical protein